LLEEDSADKRQALPVASAFNLKSTYLCCKVQHTLAVDHTELFDSFLVAEVDHRHETSGSLCVLLQHTATECCGSGKRGKHVDWQREEGVETMKAFVKLLENEEEQSVIVVGACFHSKKIKKVRFSH
jgi:hypothetical protein